MHQVSQSGRSVFSHLPWKEGGMWRGRSFSSLKPHHPQLLLIPSVCCLETPVELGNEDFIWPTRWASGPQHAERILGPTFPLATSFTVQVRCPCDSTLHMACWELPFRTVCVLGPPGDDCSWLCGPLVRGWSDRPIISYNTAALSSSLSLL